MISTFRFCTAKVAFNSAMSYSIVREARMLNKMLKKSSGSKAKKAQNKVIIKGLLSTPYDNDYGCSRTRASALNKMYMEHITEMINTGEWGRKLADLEIEITKVRISSGLNFLNIYFISRKFDTPDNVLKETLSGALAELQAKMGKITHTPKVPYLNFIKDARLENEIKLEKIFEVMDFGKNYEPLNDKKVFTQDQSKKEDRLPEMKQDIYGIDVAKIKNKIAADILRYRAIKIETTMDDKFPEFDFSRKLMEFNKKEFFKFYKRRRIEELKRRKMENRERERSNPHFEFIPYDEFEDECDYDSDNEEYVDVEDEDNNEDNKDREGSKYH